MLYDLLIMDDKGKVHIVQCYGLDKVTSAGEVPEKEGYAKLCKNFDIASNEVEKPTEIHLLLSMRCNYLHPEAVVQRSIRESLWGLLQLHQNLQDEDVSSNVGHRSSSSPAVGNESVVMSSTALGSAKADEIF